MWMKPVMSLAWSCSLLPMGLARFAGQRQTVNVIEEATNERWLDSSDEEQTAVKDYAY